MTRDALYSFSFRQWYDLTVPKRFDCTHGIYTADVYEKPYTLSVDWQVHTKLLSATVLVEVRYAFTMRAMRRWRVRLHLNEKVMFIL